MRHLDDFTRTIESALANKKQWTGTYDLRILKPCISKLGVATCTEYASSDTPIYDHCSCSTDAEVDELMKNSKSRELLR